MCLITDSFPPITLTGNPPDIAFPKQVRSDVTPHISWASRRLSRTPVYFVEDEKCSESVAQASKALEVAHIRFYDSLVTRNRFSQNRRDLFANAIE